MINGQVVAITGASSGIGRATGQHEARFNPDVKVCDFAASLWVLRLWHDETSS
jgi:NAD(P)-dependent dehydrogenase (short-subunit alcohol dehydrogenase family)